MSTFRPLLLILVMTFLVVGCSDQDDPAAPDHTLQDLTVLIRGAMPDADVDFEFAAKVGEGMDAEGELLVRGRNMEYDDELGALSIDLSVLNDSDTAFPLPVGLTFLQFMPEGVTVLESDNDQHGVGAMIMFEFENEDLSWTPGEESIPRTVHFVIPSGTSLGFVARIDAGLSPTGGTIGGLVWHDMNEDGMVDEGEEGVGGVPLGLFPANDMTMGPLISVMTNEDGTYRFPGQSAGYYTVKRMPVDGMTGTTPDEMAVILVEMDGTVSDFLAADFGVVRGDDPGDDFVRVGDYVNVKGWYKKDPDRLFADKFEVKHCDGAKRDDDDDDDDDDCDDCDDDDDGDDCDDDCDDDRDDDSCGDDSGCRQNACWGRIAGPVTGWSLQERYLEIMGTKVYFRDKGWDWDDEHDWDRGVRYRVDAWRDADMYDGDVMACRKPHWWNGNGDRIRGFVQEVVRGDDDRITGVVVLNTLVEIKDTDKPRD